MSGRASDHERMKLWDEISRRVDKSRLVAVQLTKGNEEFGFNIRGGVDHPHVGSDPGIFITTVKAHCTAGVDGRMEQGDRILALNATSLECVTRNVAVNEFRKAKEPVWLLLEKKAEAQLLGQASHDERKKLWDELSRGVDKPRYVCLPLMKDKKSKGFGFTIRGGVDQSFFSSDPGIFISAVRAGSTADGRLEPGDRILSLNGTSLQCVTHCDAVKEFRKAEEPVWLLLERKAEAQLLTQQVPNSPAETVTVGSPILGPCEEEPPNPTFGLLKQFHESKLGALSNGLAGASTIVPRQILARGPLALDAYYKALSEGETCDKRVPIMLIGQDRSGKTSLKNSLRGKPFNADEDSTTGITVDPSHFKVSSAIWKVGEKDQETNSHTSIAYEHHAARLTVENLRQIESISNERETELMQTVSSNTVPAECSYEYHNSTSSSSDINDIKDSILGFPRSLSQTPSDHELSTDSMPGMPDSIATLIEKMLGDVDKVEDKEAIYSVLWDFGGQSVYYVTHPLFLTSKAIYLLVNDLSRDPHERAKSVMKQGMYSTSEDSLDFRTNLDYLHFWMSSIASLAIEDDGDQQGSKSELLPEKLPPVFLVCTHADAPYDGGDPSKLAYRVFGSLQTKPYKTHLYDDVFFVDNTKSGSESECSEVVRLRTEILDVAKELPQMREAIPIKWLRFEKVLQDVKNDGHKCISLDRANQLASEVCNIVDDKQFHTLLNFLHDKRVLVHFDDTPELNRLVVLDPQWLIDVFKGVITVRPYSGKEKKFKQLWCKLEMKGILDEKLLEHVWNDLFLPQETFESLIAIMEKFSLLCHLPPSDESCCKQYLVPSMLKFPSPDGIVELIKSAELPSLFLQFESGLVPPGLFPRLVLQFFHRAKDECVTSVDPHLYHNFARFYTPEENYSVILLCHLFSIEVVVHKGNSSEDVADRLRSKLSLSEDTSFDSCVRAVRRQLALILESMRKEFCWLKNMKYKVSFICPVCCEGNAVKYCGTHDAKRCEQEECLHFWSESQLCSVKTLFCKKSAVAQNNRVPTEQFVPWLVPLGNQHTADEQDWKSLGPAEATKEIAIPGNVHESLLSRSCDAKEVVLQMRNNMQLEQASLEQPDSETKTLIRCLARKAIDSNRLDVFERLREITPAGTTGPLLPEHLDVRRIPVSKVRDLTIYLSGREEWKVVAEALGLTPSEIRFLDKRTLNPLDAALCFVARQRYITVGDLYDLLNKHGFPVIADFL